VDVNLQLNALTNAENTDRKGKTIAKLFGAVTQPEYIVESLVNQAKLQEGLAEADSFNNDVAYTSSDTKFNKRGLGRNRTDAAAHNFGFAFDPRVNDYVNVKVVPMEATGNAFGVVTSVGAGGPRLRKYASLGIDADEDNRRMAAERTLDLVLPVMYEQDKPNMSFEDYRQSVLDYSRFRYGYNGAILGKQTHHTNELDSTDGYLQAIANPSNRIETVRRILNEGYGLGDTATNMTALYGNKMVGTPYGFSDTRPHSSFDQHQSGVHPEYDRLAKALGAPKTGTEVETIPPVTKRITKAIREKNDTKELREQALKLKQDIENITNKNYTIESGMKGLSDEQQQARALLHVYIGDLAVKNVINDEIQKNDPEIKNLLKKIDDVQKEIHGDAVVDYERGFMKNLGIDIDDELITNRIRPRR